LFISIISNNPKQFAPYMKYGKSSSQSTKSLARVKCFETKPCL